MTFKRIDPKIGEYHYFELSPTEFLLIDGEFDGIIIKGSRNLVDGTVRGLPKNVTVVYYKRDTSDKVSFKKKVIYRGSEIVKK